MFCTSCGTYIKDEHNFCTECGAAKPVMPETKKGSILVPILLTGSMLILGGIVYFLAMYGWMIP